MVVGREPNMLAKEMWQTSCIYEARFLESQRDHMQINAPSSS
jgi:hypothetical protein